MVQALGLGLHLAQGSPPAMVMAASFDPEAGLSLTASLPQGALDPELDPHTLKPMVFAADAVFRRPRRMVCCSNMAAAALAPCWDCVMAVPPCA